jgi:hypothetical protein
MSSNFDYKRMSQIVTDIKRNINNPVPTEVEELKESFEYRERHNKMLDELLLHLGQRKLCLSEIEFLTRVRSLWETDRKGKYVIYAGAAPNHKGMFLAELFPEHTFVFVDPGNFEVRYGKQDGKSINSTNFDHQGLVYLKRHPVVFAKNATHGRLYECLGKYAEAIMAERNSRVRVFLIEDFMNLELARNLAILGSDNIIYISDIRTAPTDLGVCLDNALNFGIMVILQPLFSMLKYRPYYFAEPIDYVSIAATEEDYEILHFALANGVDFQASLVRGCQLIPLGVSEKNQAWARPSSCETRIWVERKDIFNMVSGEWNMERRYRYHNLFNRTFKHYANRNANAEVKFGHCFSCARENQVWEDYFITSFPRLAREEHRASLGRLVVEKVIQLGDILDQSLVDNHTQCVCKDLPERF